MKTSAVIKKVLLLTEKSSYLKQLNNQYVVKVDLRANKREISKAVQSVFNVKVLSVRTMIMRGQLKRMGRGYSKMSNWKKAIITLNKGDEINQLDNLNGIVNA